MPEGVDRDILRERGVWLAEICKEEGFRFSPPPARGAVGRAARGVDVPSSLWGQAFRPAAGLLPGVSPQERRLKSRRQAERPDPTIPEPEASHCVLVREHPSRGNAFMLQDFIFGLKILLKQKSFTIAALLTIALCIGANTAISPSSRMSFFGRCPFPTTNRLVTILQRLSRSRP